MNPLPKTELARRAMVTLDQFLTEHEPAPREAYVLGKRDCRRIALLFLLMAFDSARPRRVLEFRTVRQAIGVIWRERRREALYR